MNVLLAVVALSVVWLVRRRKTRLPFPPGPKQKFLIGNALDLPKRHEWVTYAQWAKVYDPDILYMNMAGQSLIILNSLAACQELLDRRSVLYSSRPRLIMVGELMGWDFSFIVMKYGPTWLKHRKFMSQSFSSDAVSKFKPHILKSTHTFMRNLLETPDNFKYHIKHMTAEVTLLITYGIKAKPQGDPFIELPDRAVRAVAEAVVPGRFLVDALPWLKYVPEWVPFAGFQRKAREWRKITMDGVDLPYQAAKKEILSGTFVDSLVSEGLRSAADKDDPEEHEDMVKRVAGTMYFAASDTTAATVLNGVLALMCHPDALKKAQAEINAIVKPGSLPDFGDRESLPYISAVVKEITRWYPVAPLGVPHCVEVGDVYKGYHIPAGSIISPNIWGIFNDESLYPEPKAFRPERYLKDGALNPDIPDPERIVLGFGRRICAGRHFASLSVWMTIACLITLFDISKPVDEDGNVIEPILEWDSSSNP
ncbi:hypothetical protein AX16_007058, partial [Volvariella volvacea WC 439]